MKRLLSSVLLSFAILFAFGQARDIAITGGTPNVSLDPDIEIPSLSASPTVIWDNGPLVNSPGTGSGGADESVLQNSSLGMSTYGFNFSYPDYIIADDFELTSMVEISSVVVYGYQTFSPTTSPITTVYLEIYDGQPGMGGTIVWGDMVTNRLTSTTWTGIYRVLETTSGNTDRAIMECVCDINTTLNAGTYWLAVQIDGSSSYSGPWCPPVTVNGQTTTGNALIYNSGSWSDLEDSSTSSQQGIPFLVLATSAVPFNIYYILAAFVMIGIGIVVKKRFF